jgi:hydrogenase maturation protein HypF
VSAIEVRVRGRVQGVGFRPTVWKLARELGVTGEVLNDGDGVLIRAAGEPSVLATFVARLSDTPPPLARVEAVETRSYRGELAPEFRIVASAGGAARTQIAPDAAICAACAAEVLDPLGRRFRYPFTTCTHCGPRLSIVTGIPYDRTATTLAGFPLCAPCAAEYGDPADRRFHAETTACHACGPRARLVRYDGRAVSFEQFSMLDDVDAVRGLLARGEIVAIKGLGGYHLACDATRPDAVARLRAAKRRDRKPFALMARSLDVIRRYGAAGALEAAALASPEAPIVLLAATGPEALPAAIAPGLATLGFMLPTTPLHHLILRGFDRPVVMTSGNLSDEPQAIDDADAATRLAGIASYALVHDRPIASRVDDSVVRVIDGAVRVLRRARGYAPAAIKLPAGFERAPALLAYGGDRKAAFCLVTRGEAILSQHQGDLDEPATRDDYEANLARFAVLFAHAPRALVVDRHVEFHASRLARDQAAATGRPVIEVGHHHAHVAACLVDNARPLAAPPVLGVVLDGLGLGDDGTLWGGEFLLADYRGAQRLGTLKPVAMLGGDRASREPWRNLYAHLVAELGWPAFTASFDELAVHAALAARPRALLDTMLASGVGAPRASSCGRLFDAVAAAVGICFERQAYEGEAAARLEAAVDPRALDEGDELAYPFAIPRLAGSGLPYLEPLAMWSAILGDLILATPVGVIAARFHRGLARAIAQMVGKLARPSGGGSPRFDTVALSGGCFQNRILFEQCARRLRAGGFTVLAHARVPANDGGLALGQAAVCAAQLLASSIVATPDSPGDAGQVAAPSLLGPLEGGSPCV